MEKLDKLSRIHELPMNQYKSMNQAAEVCCGFYPESWPWIWQCSSFSHDLKHPKAIEGLKLGALDKHPEMRLADDFPR